MSKIVVIGATHLDIVSEYGADEEAHVDRVGRWVEFSLGGSAYNIAANLSQHGIDVTLVTAIRDNATSGLLLTELLKRSPIKALIQNVGTESAYICQRSSGVLKTAVTCSNSEQMDFKDRRIANAIRQCSLVAIDTNLKPTQIRAVRDLCKKMRKPLFVSCVSQTKTLRLREIGGAKDPRFSLVCMNEVEAQSLFGDNYERMAAEEITKKAFSNVVVITRAARGFVVYTAGKSSTVREFSAPEVNITSDLGAGDALFAGICDFFLERHELTWEHSCEQRIQSYVQKVLAVKEATVGAAQIPEIAKDTSERQTVVFMLLLLVDLILLTFALWAPLTPIEFGCAFFIIPAVSGTVGSLTWNVWTRNTSHNSISQAGLGMVAGVISAITFTGAQLAGGAQFDLKADVVQQGFRLLTVFEFIIALGAGFALDKVFIRMERQEGKVPVPSLHRGDAHSRAD